MLSRELYLDNIADSLAYLRCQIEIRREINLYDINIVSETFFAGLLNLIEGYELINANASDRNASGVDLIDEKNGISIQVTSDSSSTKIQHTLDEFRTKELYKKYDRVILLLLAKKKNYTTEFDTQGLFTFDMKSDIWDIGTLIREINKLPTEKLQEINAYLDKEMKNKGKGEKPTESIEVETIINLIEFITSHRETQYKNHDTVVDPEYKIYKRFREFAQRLMFQYKMLFGIYETALTEIKSTRGSDDAQELLIMMYLQDLSLEFLDKAGNDPMEALNNLVSFFAEKLGSSGKKYDHEAIKFYLLHEMISCNVFPNERSQYDGD